MSDIVERLRYRLDKGGPGTPCIIGYSDPGIPLEHDVAEAVDVIDTERALADDLAAVLDRTLIALRARQGFPNLVADGGKSLARYREARQR